MKNIYMVVTRRDIDGEARYYASIQQAENLTSYLRGKQVMSITRISNGEKERQ